MAVGLFSYHLRLAGKSLRRDPWLSATIVLVMTVVSGIFCTALQHYLRVFGPRAPLPASLHHVEVGPPPREVADVLRGTTAEPSAAAMRLRVSYPSYLLLASSGIPARQTGTFRSRLMVARPSGGARGRPQPGAPVPGALGGARDEWELSRPQNARFVDADFFEMFRVRLGRGTPWTKAEQAAHAAVVVVTRRLAAELFPGENPVGETLLVNGLPYRVTGVCAEDPSLVPPWDPSVGGSAQDLVFLPFAEHERLLAVPEMPYRARPIGRAHADLFGPDEVFISFWAELPTPEARRDYAAHLAKVFGPTHTPYHLRDVAALRSAFPNVVSAVSFFLFLTFIVLWGGGLITARLLLAKGLARAEEMGIFRALGAPRRAIFSRQLIEAGLLSGGAGLLSALVAGPQTFFYNRAIADTDIPLTLTPMAFGITVSVTLGVGLMSAVYPAWRASTFAPTVTLGRR